MARRMRGPTLAQLFQARQGGYYAASTPAESGPLSPEERAILEAEMQATGKPPSPIGPVTAQVVSIGRPEISYGRQITDLERRGLPVGQSTSPDVFGSQMTDAELRQQGLTPVGEGAQRVYASDPSSVRRVTSELAPADRERVLQEQVAQTARHVPGWEGKPVEFFEGTFVDPGGTAVDMRDPRQVNMWMDRAVSYASGEGSPQQISAIARQGAASPGITPSGAPSISQEELLQGLMMKGREADPMGKDFVSLPGPLAQQYGIPGFNTSQLSIGEKLALRRMGVSFPAPRR